MNQLCASKMSAHVDQSSINLDELVHLTSGFSGAEIVSCCSEAALLVVSEGFEHSFVDNNQTSNANQVINQGGGSGLRDVTQKDLLSVIQKIVPQITTQMIEFYESYKEKTRL